MRTTLRALSFFIFLLISLPLLAQQPAKSKTKKAKTDTTAVMQDATTTQGGGGGAEMIAPYTATYSSKFTMGNPEHARMVLTMWKDWDDNMLDRNAAMIADTIVMFLPHGQMLKGKDSFMMASKQHRNSLGTVKSTVHAYMPLRSTDKNENWVAIWGMEESTGSDGQKNTNLLQEIWRINKDGKIDLIRQYAAKPPVQ